MRRILRMLSVPLALAAGLFVEAVFADESAELAGLIDGQIERSLGAAKLARVAQADDAEFVRRVHLDLHGVVPTAERTTKFLEDASPQKRQQLIDELLAGPRFGEHFGDIWRKNLISPLADDQRVRGERFAGWLASRFNDNEGWDRMVSELVTATGKMEDNPAVTYLIEGRHPLGVTELTDLTSRYFLGVRLNCAQCHDHPHVAWKRQDYWGMAAFFTQIQTPGRAKMVYVAGVQDNPKVTLATLKEADMLEGYESRQPTFLGGDEPAADGKSLRVALAHWMTSKENPYFARAAVNRTWWHFFGRGIVNPVDDMHTGNVPSHPELLELLSRRFADSGFDLKFLCRAILTSRTYQQTSRPGKEPDREAELFARMPIKVLSPEQLYDSLVAILGPPGKTSSIDARLGARQEFCQFFAADGDTNPTRYERGIPHVLRLMNSPQFAGRSIEGLVSQLSKSGSEEDTAEKLFLTILSRRPTDAELELVRDQVRRADGSAETAHRQLAWALLMSSEFSLNH